MLDAMREYFLNPDKPTPASLEIYVWPYVGDTQIVSRGFAYIHDWGRQPILGDVLKFLPLAFWLVFECPSTEEITLPSLPIHTTGLDEEVKIRLPLKQVPPPTWPAAPGDTGIVLMNDEFAFAARPHRNKTS
jgi:hypothetical protein